MKSRLFMVGPTSTGVRTALGRARRWRGRGPTESPRRRYAPLFRTSIEISAEGAGKPVSYHHIARAVVSGQKGGAENDSAYRTARSPATSMDTLMTLKSLARSPRSGWAALSYLALPAAMWSAAACASGGSQSGGAGPSPAGDMSMTAPTPDPRVGLKAGWYDAGEAIRNLQIVFSKTPASKDFTNPSTPGDRRLVNSDLAFLGNYVIQGNYSGMQIWDIANPHHPTLRTAYVCPGSQSDVSVYGHLLFVSAEATNGRIDCGLQGVANTISGERARGIRIYDISNIRAPQVAHHCADLPGLAHEHAGDRSAGQHERLHLRLGFGAGPPVRRARGMLQRAVE